MAVQDGVITLGQAIAAGMSQSAVSRRISSGEWRRVVRGVYMRSDERLTHAAKLRSAVYGAGPNAAACGPSAAWWLGLDVARPIQHWITTPRSTTPVRRRGVRIRHRDLHHDDLTLHRHLPVTALPLTVIEAAVLLDDATVVDRALQQQIVSLADLEAAHKRNKGRHGSKAAAGLLRTASEGGASEGERMLHRLLRQAGITGWKPHVRACGFEIDVAFEAQRIAIEVDGWAWHRDVDRFNHDAHRQNILSNAGWLVLRFTWHDLKNRPRVVIATIRRALAQRAS